MKSNQPAPFFLSEKRKLILLPVGSIEQHGPFLPVDTDLRIAQLLAEELSLTFNTEDVLLLPAIPFSCSWEHRGLGTIALNVSTLSTIIHDIAYSLKTWDTPILLILINWHGGNDVLAPLATEITARENIPTAVIPSISQVGKAWDASNITTAKDIHAGAVETSIIQAYWPELIKIEITKSAHQEPNIAPAKAQAVLQTIGSYAITTSGIWGAPEDANVTKGEKIIDDLIKSMHNQALKLLELVNKYER